MKLLTKTQNIKLLKNGEAYEADPDFNPKPVVKIFGSGAATWLLASIEPDDHDLAYGLCDPGLGYPELGYVRISELKRYRDSELGIGLERDRYWIATKTLVDYAREARNNSRIMA